MHCTCGDMEKVYLSKFSFRAVFLSLIAIIYVMCIKHHLLSQQRFYKHHTCWCVCRKVQLNTLMTQLFSCRWKSSIQLCTPQLLFTRYAQWTTKVLYLRTTLLMTVTGTFWFTRYPQFLTLLWKLLTFLLELWILFELLKYWKLKRVFMKNTPFGFFSCLKG